VHASSTDAIIEAVTEADSRGEPLLIVGGGSNLLVADEGFDGTAVRIATTGFAVESQDSCSGVQVRVAAGVRWGEFVTTTIERGWAGAEALSGIPGSVGATPIQNVGAYGQEVAQTVAAVRTWDRQQGRMSTLAAADCEFGYRNSRFKMESFRGAPRYVVLEVTFQFKPADLSMPVAYTELASALGIEVGGRAPLSDVRQMVLRLRTAKGMLLDPQDHDTWSSGSFFTNPVLTDGQAADLPEEAPRWPAGDGLVKTSAAWLIERAGFARGFGLPGPAALSGKHALAVTNRGEARAADILVVVRAVRDGVRARFGVELAPETVLVGCDL
jgi:UDP-N-acetylmuramate dehydrogenase